MRVDTFYTLKAKVTSAEATHTRNIAKSRSSALAPKTRAKYGRLIPTSQRTMLEARAKLDAFISAAKLRRH